MHACALPTRVHSAERGAHRRAAHRTCMHTCMAPARALRCAGDTGRGELGLDVRNMTDSLTWCVRSWGWCGWGRRRGRGLQIAASSGHACLVHGLHACWLPFRVRYALHTITPHAPVRLPRIMRMHLPSLIMWHAGKSGKGACMRFASFRGVGALEVHVYTCMCVRGFPC